MLPSAPRDPEAVKGVMFGLTAYTMWGCFPLFFALFDGVPAFEILIHRILWSCLFLVGLISVLGRWSPVVGGLVGPKSWGRVFCFARRICF